MNKKFIIVIACFIIIFVGVVWSIDNKQKEEPQFNRHFKNNENLNNQEPFNHKSEETKDPLYIGIVTESNKKGWKNYRNTAFDLEFQFPDHLFLDENIRNISTLFYEISLNNFLDYQITELPDRVPYPIHDGELQILFNIHRVDLNVNDENAFNFESWYKNNIEYTDEKMQKEIDFMNRESNSRDILGKKDIVVKKENMVINQQSFVVQSIKHLKPNNIEGGAITTKNYTTFHNDLVFDIKVITTTTKNADKQIALFDEIMQSMQF